MKMMLNFCFVLVLSSETFAQINIGDFFGGGFVFYIDPNGHGLIAAPWEQGELAKWGCSKRLIGLNLSTSKAIGSGQSNTEFIINTCDELDNAAKFCDTLIYNGYNDWFLPSKDELNEMFLKRYAIGYYAFGVYWSSTEALKNDAWGFDYYFGHESIYNKNRKHIARCIRAF